MQKKIKSERVETETLNLCLLDADDPFSSQQERCMTCLLTGRVYP